MLYWFVIKDHESRQYSIHGPLSDEVEWSNRIGAAQERGRNIVCLTVPASTKRADIAARVEADGYVEGNIVLG